MKYLIILFAILSFQSVVINAQSYNSEKVALTNFLVRMYNNAPFEGVRIVNDYDNNYLLSVLALDKSKYANQSALSRVASVKAMSQASRFFNGSTITSELIIHTTENSNKEAETEIIETIKENSIGYVKTLEQLTNFTREDGWQVFIFMTKVDKCDFSAKKKN